MRTRRQKRALAPEIVELRERMEHWRKTRKSRKPMPPELWHAAVAVAGKLGVHPVSSALKLNYNTLKERVKQSERPGRSSETQFVELRVAPVRAAGLELEFVHGRGDKMVMRLPAAQIEDAVVVARAFWSREK